MSVERLLDVEALAQATVDTIREPILVLDKDLRVIAANRAYYSTFLAERQHTQGESFSGLGEGQWDISALRDQLERVAPNQSVLEAFEIEIDSPLLGRRTVLLNARRLFSLSGDSANIVVAIEDVTNRRAVERERDELLRQKDILLAEIEHRIANSLAIIASILLLKARTVTSPETRAQLEDAHKRVMSVAAVQKHLHAAKSAETIELGPYLTQLCASLSASMINDEDCAIEVQVVEGVAAPSAAVSMGLVVTELVINALKHAFPEGRAGCAVVVKYEVNGSDWKLSVSDNGVGLSEDKWPPAKVGLGTSIVQALAAQLDARVDVESGAAGTSVSIAHSTFKSRAAAIT